MGFEPTTPGTTIQCSNQLSYTHHVFHSLRIVAYTVLLCNTFDLFWIVYFYFFRDILELDPLSCGYPFVVRVFAFDHFRYIVCVI